MVWTERNQTCFQGGTLNPIGAQEPGEFLLDIFGQVKKVQSFKNNCSKSCLLLWKTCPIHILRNGHWYQYIGTEFSSAFPEPGDDPLSPVDEGTYDPLEEELILPCEI